MKPAFPTTGQRPPLDLILTGGSAVGLGDGPLLDRVASGDGPSAGAALDALIRRHGALVARVCRGILGDSQLAEDATQAVFLVLIRCGGSIRDPDRLAPWLHGVALRTARAARRQHRRSLTSPIPLDETTMIDPTPDPAQTLIRRERAEILHEAINRLPRRYLDPIVLCDLSGLTHAEAAAHLDCPPSTVGVRLKLAREKLRAKLSRHRLDFETALPPAVGLSSIPRTLAASPAAHFLANRVAWTLAATKWQALAVVLLFTGVATVGVRAGYQTPAPAVVPSATTPPPRQDPPETPAAPAPADVPPWLKLGVPTVRDVRDSETFQGQVVASRRVTIRPRTSEILTSVEVAEGDLVEKGQILFVLGTPQHFPEYQELILKRQATQDRLQKIRDAAKLPDDPALAKARNQLDTLDQEFKKLLDENQVARIMAPFAGQIARLRIAAGSFVEVGKTELAELVMVDPIQVDFQVDEKSYVKIQRWLRSQPGTTHLPVQVALADEEAFDHPGQVLFRATQFEQYDDGRRCTLHAELPNSDGALVPGLTARVRVEYGEPRRETLVPMEAFWNEPNDPAVGIIWGVDANRIAHLRNFRFGKLRGELLEVLGGIDPQTQIILNGGIMSGDIPGFGIVDGQPLPPSDAKQPEVPMVRGPGMSGRGMMGGTKISKPR